MAKKKPDVVDTEPPEEARPDTTATPLLVENGKVSPDVEFTPTQLLKVFEYLADKHNKSRLHDAAWGIVQAIDTEDYTTGAEILDIDPAWWEKTAIAQAHVRLIRAVFGNVERLTVFGTPVKATPGYVTPGHGPAGLSTPANSSMSGPSADSIMMATAIAKLLEDSSERMSTMQHQQAIMNAELAKTQAELNLKARTRRL